jgi:hypothetical protein
MQGLIMKKILLFLLLVLFMGCSAKESARTKKHHSTYQKYHTFIRNAEAKATTPARKVMQTIRTMVENRVVIRGACWDYLDRAFTKAGYPQKRRTIVYKGTKRGPFVGPSKIRRGDWLYYINHSYHNIEHSGMFIGWTDYSKKRGLIMSYAGQGRAEPARYKVYDLSSVYHIMRAE